MFHPAFPADENETPHHSCIQDSAPRTQQLHQWSSWKGICAGLAILFSLFRKLQVKKKGERATENMEPTKGMNESRSLQIWGANLLTLSGILQVGTLQWLPEELFHWNGTISTIEACKKLLKIQVTHVLRCSVRPLQRANEAWFTWSVKMQLLLVPLMIYKALSQGNAMICREA